MRRRPDCPSRYNPTASTVASNAGLKKFRIGNSWWTRPMELARYTATLTSNTSQGCVPVFDSGTVTVLTSLVARTSSGIGATHFRRDDFTSGFGRCRLLAYRREDGARHGRVVAARS